MSRYVELIKFLPKFFRKTKNLIKIQDHYPLGHLYGIIAADLCHSYSWGDGNDKIIC